MSAVALSHNRAAETIAETYRAALDLIERTMKRARASEEPEVSTALVETAEAMRAIAYGIHCAQRDLQPITIDLA